jgi:AraC family transcriptional regulator, regulatory protein of adaptative response / methylated-DNA-[protein]-cysteine methyltransferase
MSVSGRILSFPVPRLKTMNELNESRWHSVETRDGTSSGIFVYAVATTGVYCRPGCGARRPLRRNVEFFNTSSEARAAGYRACHRCRPDRDVATDPAVVAVTSLCRELERGGELDIGATAKEIGYSERHLRRLFRDLVGVPIGTYQRALRAERARETMKTGATVTEAVVESGFGSFRGFYEQGAVRLGMTPSRFRHGARGELIRYTTLETPLGVVVVAGTKRGVCFLRFGRDEGPVVEVLLAEFPEATITRDDNGLAEVALVLAGAVRGERDAAVLPLDLEGTAFQIRVWEALRRIPPGETRTYSQVAVGIGAPNSVRAVASACAANRVALAVPCHRVVRADGSLGGYRWGMDVKQALLVSEGVPALPHREFGAKTQRSTRD